MTSTPEQTEVEQLRKALATTQKSLDRSRAEFRRQLEVAAKVHRTLLPEPARHERLLVDTRYIPIENVGGDYCQVRFPNPDTCYITMCDVPGHGIAPALLATRVSSEVRHFILDNAAPHEIVRELNKFIYGHFEETGLYLTFIAARIDLGQRLITWSGAGHPSPFLIRHQSETIDLLESQNTVVGAFDRVLGDEPQHTLGLEPGDRLLFYTDGLTEAADPSGCLLGTDGLAGISRRTLPCDLFSMADQILNQVGLFSRGAFDDDMTVIVADVR